jgi:hypothetical protein
MAFAGIIGVATSWYEQTEMVVRARIVSVVVFVVAVVALFLVERHMKALGLLDAQAERKKRIFGFGALATIGVIGYVVASNGNARALLITFAVVSIPIVCWDVYHYFRDDDDPLGIRK